MRGIRRTVVLLLAATLLLAAGCAGESDRQEEARILAPGGLGRTTTYHLETMEPGELNRTANLTVAQSWQMLKTVRTGGSELRLEELRVTRGQKVSAGDPVAVLRGTGSEADVELKELEIRSFLSGQQETLAWYEGRISAAEALPADTELRARIRELEIEYARLEYEKYRSQSDYALEGLRAQLSELEAAVGETVLVAPVDGTVRSVTIRYSAGDAVPAGAEICTIYAAAGLRFTGSSSTSTFVYGREVTVDLRRGSRQQTVTGRVVSSPEVAGGIYATSAVLLEIDAGAEELLTTDGNAQVSYTILKDALVVPRSAVSSRDGVSCVDLLIGDTVCTRTVVRGPATASEVAVLQGLKPGDQVVVGSYNS